MWLAGELVHLAHQHINPECKTLKVSLPLVVLMMIG